MKNIYFFIFIFTFAFTHTSNAQTIVNVKEKKVLIDLEGENLNPGDKFFAVDEAGKRKALLQIKQVKNGKAVAEILKGAAISGMAMVAAGKAHASARESSAGSIRRGPLVGSAYGFTGALMMNTMKISSFDTTNYGSRSFEMVGTNFGASVFYDYPLSSNLFARGHGSLEMFDVKKKSSLPICKNETSTDCNATFLQTGFYGTFNLSLTPSPKRFWIGAGGGALIYLSKESTVLQTSRFFFNTMIMAAGGLDYFTSRNTFIPVTFEYQIIPDKEAGVTSLVLRAGWGRNF